jgi:hypothetical protein
MMNSHNVAIKDFTGGLNNISATLTIIFAIM